MRSQRAWFASAMCPGTCVYVERIVSDCADGMPRQETSLLATVYRNKYRFEAVIRQPEDDVFLPDFLSADEAMTAVCNYLSKIDQRDIHGKAQLL